DDWKSEPLTLPLDLFRIHELLRVVVGHRLAAKIRQVHQRLRRNSTDDLTTLLRRKRIEQEELLCQRAASGHTDLLRYDSALGATHERGSAGQRREHAASEQDVVESAGGRNRRARESAAERREEGDTRNAAGWGGLATIGEHLHASVYQGI